MLEYFPRDSRAAIMHLMAAMCPHREALRWLISEMVNHVGKWPGPADFRGLLCTRYEPADGIDQWCSLPGYRPFDSESKCLAEHEQRKIQEKVGGYVLDEESRELVKKLNRGVKQIGAKA